jgi:uncharacterized protein
MTACDLYHGWFYHHGALRLASSLGWGLQMLKADARQKSCARPATASNSLGQSSAQTGVQPFREHPALHGEGVPAMFSIGSTTPSPAITGRLDVSRSLEKSAFPPCISPAGTTCFSHGSIDGFLALTETRASSLRPRASISDRRAVAAHSLGRPHRRLGLRPRSAARYRRDPAALVQSLAEGFRRIRGRAENPPFRSRRKSLARSESLAGRAKRFLSAQRRGANSRKGDGELSPPLRDRSLDDFCLRPGSAGASAGRPRRASGQFDQSSLELGQQRARLHLRAHSQGAATFSARRELSLLLHFFGPHRLHREVRS